MKFDVLFEDNHLLVVDKPPGVATMGVSADKPSIVSLARDYLREKYRKPGNVYLGVVSRLDAPVTGVLLIARTSKSAGRLTTAFRDRQVEKTYLALVEGQPEQSAARLEHYVRKDERHRKVHVTTASADGAQRAVLNYAPVATLGDHSLLHVNLETGRKHQIRVQLAKIGHPIVGDRKYGASEPFSRGIALHSYRLSLTHPVRNTPLAVVAPLPGWWPQVDVHLP